MKSVKNILLGDCDACSTSINFEGCVACLKVAPGFFTFGDQSVDLGACVSCDQVRHKRQWTAGPECKIALEATG